VNPRNLRLLLTFVMTLGISLCHAQKEVTYSLGAFGGITSTFTFDEGINKDARYEPKYGVDFIPGGIHIGIDFNGYGFMVDPQVTQIGQSFNILNTVGGQVGERQVNLTYFQLPLSYKKHVIDLSFFKVSWILGVSYAHLLSGEETITHSNQKLVFPVAVYPILEQPENKDLGYVIEYDGVVSPARNDFQSVRKSDFKSMQVFASVGIRSDWDITDHARISFDFRANAGVFDPRTEEYVDRANANQTIYEVGGKRRDFFASITVGYSRYLFVETKAKNKKVKQFQHYGPKRKIPK